jgi:hypothetical protein
LREKETTMPVLLDDSTLDQQALAGSHYGYSATRIDDLGASEYTIVTVAVDASPSVQAFRQEMEAALKQIVQACRLSPRADNLMFRLTSFSAGVTELHGFKLLERCNMNDYDGILNIQGWTALYDAAENAVSATADYGKRLFDNDYAANAIVFVITDGQDNKSTATPQSVREALSKGIRAETLESMVSILIGVNVNDPAVARDLADFHKQAGFTQYIELDKADAKTLAKLAAFVAQSISLQSQALGTGGRSRSLIF